MVLLEGPKTISIIISPLPKDQGFLQEIGEELVLCLGWPGTRKIRNLIS